MGVFFSCGKMVAVNRGDNKRRRIPSDEVVEYHELKTLKIVKTESPDEHGEGSLAPGSSSTLDHFHAQIEDLRGYDEEIEGDDNSSIGTVNVEDEESHCEISELRGLGPLDRRLNENRSYNEGNWTSVELKALYDGITTYGTTTNALDVIQSSYCTTRTLNEVISKVNEIRAINSEYAVDRIKSQSDQWQRIGYRNVCAIPQRVIPPEIDNWEAAIHRVNRQIRSHNDCAISDSIKKALLDAPMDAENPALYKVTHFRGVEGYGKEQAVSWQRLREFFVGVINHSRPLPPLNPLECAIALRMVDEVEDESARLLTDNERAIIRGWLANIQMRDLRDFLPDLPYSVNSAARMFVDPLRTYSWGFTDFRKSPGSIPVNPTSSGDVEAQPT